MSPQNGQLVHARKKRPVMVFDFMGVIFREGLVLTKLLIPMFRPPLPMAEIQKRYRRLVTGEISSEQFWCGMVPDQQQAQHEYLRCFDLGEGFEIIYELKNHYSLAALSEIPVEWANHLVKKFQLDTLFDEMVLSGEVGVTKPDVRIFQILIRRLGKERTYFFIDDNQNNLAVASTLGWKTIWMKNQVSGFRRPGFKPDTTIRSLRELEKLLPEPTRFRRNA